MNEKLPQTREDAVKPKRFVEKGRDVVYDTVTQIYWMKKDSWQDKGKFYNWHESLEYADKKNMRKPGGFSDWRMPIHDEIVTLFDKESENPAKGGGNIHLDTVFPEGAFKMVWLMGDTSTRRPRFDFTDGTIKSADEYSFGAVRLCRKDLVRREDNRPRKRG